MSGSNYRGYAFALIVGIVLVYSFVWALADGNRHGKVMDIVAFQKGCFTAILAANNPKVRGRTFCPKALADHLKETGD